MSTAPHEVLSSLRSLQASEQMAVFAEALYMRQGADVDDRYFTPFRSLALVAAAYMLGRIDSLAGAGEPNGSARPMAEAVLLAARVLHDGDPRGDADVPF